MSAIALLVSSSVAPNDPVQEMVRAYDAPLSLSSPWDFHGDRHLAIAARQGSGGGLSRKTLAHANGLVAALDGRIDNREELWRECRPTVPQGPEADTSDAALLLAVFRHYGSAFPEKLEGDFCALVYDVAAGRVILARDCLGHRTIYYATTALGVAFATSVRQFVPFFGGKGRLDPVYFSEYLIGSGGAGSLEGERTPFAEVRRLRPGFAAQVDARNGQVTLRRFFEPNSVSLRRRTTLADEVERFRDALTLSVRRHLAGSATVGIEVSGGIDSASVAILASRCCDARARLMGFHYRPRVYPPTGDKTVYVQALARSLGIPLQEVIVEDGGITQLSHTQDDLVSWLQDEPGSTFSLPNFTETLKALRSQGVGVLLRGAGEGLTRCPDPNNPTLAGLEMYQALRHLDLRAMFLLFATRWRRRSHLFDPNLLSVLPHRCVSLGDPKIKKALEALCVFDMRSPALIRAAGDGECWPGALVYRSPQELRYMGCVRPDCEQAFVNRLYVEAGIDMRAPMRSLPVLRATLGCPSHVLPGVRDRELLRLAVEHLFPPEIREKPKIPGEYSSHYMCLAAAAAQILAEKDPLQVELRNLADGTIVRGMMREVVTGRLRSSRVKHLFEILTLENFLRKHPLVGPVETIGG